MTNTIEDEVVEEVHQRQPLRLRSLDYDLTRIAEDLQREERKSGRPKVTR